MVIDDFLSVFTLTSFCVRPNERSHVQSFGHTFGRTMIVSASIKKEKKYYRLGRINLTLMGGSLMPLLPLVVLVDLLPSLGRHKGY